MKQLIFVLALVFGSQLANAQSYNTAAGLRLGSGIGISVQQRVANKTTIEGIINSRFKKDQVSATILVEQHFPILIKRFNIYTGLGAHKGWHTANTDDGVTYKDPYGVSLIGGAEITLGRFNISYDYKPSFNIQGGEKAFNSETSLSIRYVIAKRPTKLDKWRKKRKKKKKNKSKSGGFKLGDIFKKK